MQRTKWGRIVAIAACAIFLSTSGFAQAIYGTIFGSVTDNTGAAIPGATVTITDTNKGTTVTATSNEAGEFTVGHLIPDMYDVSVTNAGFKTFASKGIQVFADQSIKVEAKMEVGGETQTVEVSATTVEQLKTDRADVSTTFGTKEVQDLPIPGRNFTNLQLLLPGAQQLGWGHAASENPQASQQIQVDGQAFGGVAFELDGTDNQDPILGIIVINPPLDALTETKITTQNFDAEFGKAVSSVVTAQTKSGTNSFHGSAFWYRESNANQARDPFSQNPPAGTNDKHGLVPPGLRNQIGGSIGGPILKDKLFFFGDYQGIRQKVGTSATATVPSAHLVSTCLGQSISSSGIPGCDFSEYLAALGPTNGTIYQANGTPYPGNVIPTAQLSQQALAFLTLLQPYAPNKGGNFGGLQNNYGGGGTGIFNNDQWDERVDFQATQSIHVFERFSRFTDTLTGTTMFGAAGGPGFGIAGYGGTSKGANDSLAAGFDMAVKSNLVTDFRIGYYRYNIKTAKYDQGTPFMDNLGIQGLNVSPITSGAAELAMADVGQFGTGASFNLPQSTGAQYGSGLQVNRCNCPLIEKEDQYQIVNNWTWIKGSHSIKMGADLRYARNLRVPSDTNRTGQLLFGNGPTSNGTTGGLGYATFVLGNVTNFSRYVSSSTNAKEFQKRVFFYAQDTWRVTPKLTANLGLRWEEYWPEVVNANGNGALMQMNNDVNTDGYLRVAGFGRFGSNMNWSRVTNPWNPRVGLAYQVSPKTVLRAGYGRSFDLGVFGSIFGHVVTQNLPVLASQSVTATGGPTSFAFALSDVAPPCNAANNCLPAPPQNGLLPAPGYQVSPKARPSSLRLPTLDAWNASLQQSLTPSLSFTIAYVGNKGTHTLSAGDGNNTNPNEAAISLPAQYSITGQPLHYDPSVKTGIAANGGTANTTFLQRYYGGSLTACQDPTYLYNANPAARPAGLPAGSCGWTNGISYYGDDQDSHYNALQVTVTKQFTKGLSFTGNYAWQQGIDFNSGFATWNKRAVRGRNNDIRTNNFVAYALYQLPFGRNQMFYSSAPGWANAIIGGWQLSPVVTWSSGLPFTLQYGECSASVPSSAPCYPNGSAKTLKTQLGGYDPVAHRRLFFHGAPTTSPLTTTPFSGFTAPGLDQIGTAGRNQINGPSYFNTDMSLQKNVPIHESIVGQFRVDAYNVFNIINPGLGGGGATAPIDSGDYFITSIQGAGTPPRLLQFSLRVQF